MYAKKNAGKKLTVVLLAIVLILCCTIGGTMAWLKTSTNPVQNTFVAGAIGTLELNESDTDRVTDGDQHEYVIIPGKDITKDPTVTYTPADANDVGTVYIFVEVTDDNWTYDNNNKTFTTDAGLKWTVADGWTYLSGKVFYMTTNTKVSAEPIIKDNTITVPGLSITKSNIAEAATAASGLTFTAYAIQAEGFKGVNAASDAWTAAKSNP